VSADEDHRVSTIEHFFDLVFVYAITQITQLMADHVSLLGAGQWLAMLAVLWWCRCSYAWLGMTIHVDHGGRAAGDVRGDGRDVPLPATRSCGCCTSSPIWGPRGMIWGSGGCCSGCSSGCCQ
jgi:hypothetical protein